MGTEIIVLENRLPQLVSPGESSRSVVINGNMFDPAITWADIKWLHGVTSLPIILKGILTGERQWVRSHE